MSSADRHGHAHSAGPEGRVVPLYRPDAHVEGRRIGAAAFDLAILAIILVWIDDVFGVTSIASGSPLRPVGGYAYFTTTARIDLPWLILLMVVVYSAQEYLFGATWGKLVAGLRVIDRDGSRPSLAAILARNVLRPVDYWPFFYLLGIVAAALSPRRQRLGDRVAHTLVVRAESAPLAYRSRAELRRNALLLLAGSALFVAFCLGFVYFQRPPLVIRGLYNTGRLLPSGDVAAYRLGPARRGSDRLTITYPLTYRSRSGERPCRGDVTLRWHGFFGGGWVPGQTVHHCS